MFDTDLGGSFHHFRTSAHAINTLTYAQPAGHEDRRVILPENDFLKSTDHAAKAPAAIEHATPT